MIRHAVPARVGMLGNPSDGFGGRTLALAVPAFRATVTVEEADGIEIVPGPDDEPRWASVAAMVEHLDRFGYRSGTCLLAAAVRTFVDVAGSLDHPVAWGFRLSYETTIPRQVGLGGSSALIIAALRGLCELHDLEIPDEILPSIALSVETTQLDIVAGLQDRVVQTYGGLVAMDFGEPVVDTRFGVTHGRYEAIDPSTLPPLFLAYRLATAEPSTLYHRHLLARYEAGDLQVRETLRELAGLVLDGRAALRWGDRDRFARLIGRNMALRASLGPLPDAQLELVEVAGALGAPATFAGSGGAVVGVIDDDDQAAALAVAYGAIGAEMLLLGPSPVDPLAADPHPADQPLGAGTVDGDTPTNVVPLGHCRPG